MARTPEEVFSHHAQALGAGDLDEIVADYSDDAIFITPTGVLGLIPGAARPGHRSGTATSRQVMPRRSSQARSGPRTSRSSTASQAGQRATIPGA
jgi:hypothetical protein